MKERNTEIWEETQKSKDTDEVVTDARHTGPWAQVDWGRSSWGQQCRTAQGLSYPAQDTGTVHPGAAGDIAAPDWNRLPLTPGHPPPAWPGALTSCSSPFRRCSYRGSVSAASVLCPPLGIQGFRWCQQPTSPASTLKDPPSRSAAFSLVPGPCPVGSA